MRDSKTLRRMLTAVLAVVMATSLSAGASAKGGFSDVPGTHQFRDAILWCAGRALWTAT